MSSNYQVITTLNLTASGTSGNSGTFDLDLVSIKEIKLLFTTTTITILNIYDGFGNGDNQSATSGIPIVKNGSSVPHYSTGGQSYTVPPGSHSMSFFRDLCPRWLRLTFQNTDVVSNGSVSVEGDI